MGSDIVDNRGRGEATWSWPGVHPEGRKFALIAAALSAFCAFMAWETLAWPFAALVPCIAAFFRDPRRVTPQGDNLVISPADGLVTLIRQMEPPKELVLDDGSGLPGLPAGPVTRISIASLATRRAATTERARARAAATAHRRAGLSSST